MAQSCSLICMNIYTYVQTHIYKIWMYSVSGLRHSVCLVPISLMPWSPSCLTHRHKHMQPDLSGCWPTFMTFPEAVPQRLSSTAGLDILVPPLVSSQTTQVSQTHGQSSVCDSQASSCPLTISLVLISDYTPTQTSTRWGHNWVSSATGSKTTQALHGPI